MAAPVITTRSLIAKEAGLSPTTVSLVLNGRADAVGIKAETQRRVREIARRHNYIPNPLARGLLGKSTRTVGLLWSLAGPHLSEGMARDIALRMQKRGYVTHLTDSLSDPEIVRRQLADYQRRGVDAVVIQDGTEELLTEEVGRQLMGFKAVVGVSIKRPTLSMDWIFHDLLAGYRQAADHLADTGRRRAAIFTGGGAGEPKVQAFLTRCLDRGMEVSDKSVIAFDYGAQLRQLSAGCRTTLEKRFSERFPFDALMCSADEVAATAISWLTGRGLRVPEDVAVIGCNNAIFSDSMRPPLASIDRRDEEVAALIEEMIFSRLGNPDLPARRREIGMTFVWRESAGGSFMENGKRKMEKGDQVSSEAQHMFGGSL